VGCGAFRDGGEWKPCTSLALAFISPYDAAPGPSNTELTLLSTRNGRLSSDPTLITNPFKPTRMMNAKVGDFIRQLINPSYSSALVMI